MSVSHYPSLTALLVPSESAGVLGMNQGLLKAMVQFGVGDPSEPASCRILSDDSCCGLSHDANVRAYVHTCRKKKGGGEKLLGLNHAGPNVLLWPYIAMSSGPVSSSAGAILLTGVFCRAGCMASTIWPDHLHNATAAQLELTLS